jgi:hypothetical protein
VTNRVSGRATRPSSPASGPTFTQTWPDKVEQKGPLRPEKAGKKARNSVEMGPKSTKMGEKPAQKIDFARQTKFDRTAWAKQAGLIAILTKL